MRKILLLVALALALSSLLPKNVDARSGCCSHHGGVCGCGCCDGSSLSTTCAPYYPGCSQPVYITPIATKAPVIYTPKPSTPKPTILPTQTPLPTVNPTTSPTPEPKPLISTTPQVQGASTSNPVGGLLGIGGLLTVCYFGLKWLGRKTTPKE